MKKILFTNDDGYESLLLHDLFNYVGMKYPDVIKLLIAPKENCSGVSHAITLDKPLVYRKMGNNKFKADGFPADCTMLGYGIFGYPDLVISGPNFGSNLGQDIIYSGTVAAAREAALHDIPALAFSFIDDNIELNQINYDDWHAFLDKWMNSLIHLACNHRGYIVNVNISIPIDLELVEAKIGKRHYHNYQSVEKGVDEHGAFQIAIAVPGLDMSKEVYEGSDVYYALQGKNVFTVIGTLPSSKIETSQELVEFMEATQ